MLEGLYPSFLWLCKMSVTCPKWRRQVDQEYKKENSLAGLEKEMKDQAMHYLKFKCFLVKLVDKFSNSLETHDGPKKHNKQNIKEVSLDVRIKGLILMNN